MSCKFNDKLIQELLGDLLEAKLSPTQQQSLLDAMQCDSELAGRVADLYLDHYVLQTLHATQTPDPFIQSVMLQAHYLDSGFSFTERVTNAARLKDILDAEATPDVEAIRTYADHQLQAFLAEQERLRPKPVLHMKSRSRLNMDVLLCSLKQVARKTQRMVVAASVVMTIVLFVLLTVQVIKAHRVVATLGETQDAKWAELPQQPQLRSQTLILETGYAKILFKKGAVAIVQGPCVFRLDSPEKMFLDTGKVTVRVPKEAIGFTIETSMSHVVDFGTEFGVSVGAMNQPEVHVFEGEVGMRSLLGRNKAKQVRLIKGQAAWANIAGTISTGKVSDRPDLFARNLPETKPAIIPGSPLYLDLADVVGGGDGFGNGELGGYNLTARGTINPLTGYANDPRRPNNHHVNNDRYDNKHFECVMSYTRTNNVPYVDGVFVPDGGQGSCVVSSKGHIFTECPDTDSQFKWNISNGWRYRYAGWGTSNTEELSQSSGITMHANLGITFDLSIIRKSYPNKEIRCFSAQAEIPITSSPVKSEVDVWILVDGQVCQKQKNMRLHDVADIQIKLKSRDRFLTLVVTDSQTEGETLYWSNLDWCFIRTPILELQ